MRPPFASTLPLLMLFAAGGQTGGLPAPAWAPPATPGGKTLTRLLLRATALALLLRATALALLWRVMALAALFRLPALPTLGLAVAAVAALAVEAAAAAALAAMPAAAAAMLVLVTLPPVPAVMRVCASGLAPRVCPSGLAAFLTHSALVTAGAATAGLETHSALVTAGEAKPATVPPTLEATGGPPAALATLPPDTGGGGAHGAGGLPPGTDSWQGPSIEEGLEAEANIQGDERILSGDAILTAAVVAVVVAGTRTRLMLGGDKVRTGDGSRP